MRLFPFAAAAGGSAGKGAQPGAKETLSGLRDTQGYRHTRGEWDKLASEVRIAVARENRAASIRRPPNCGRTDVSLVP